MPDETLDALVEIRDSLRLLVRGARESIAADLLREYGGLGELVNTDKQWAILEAANGTLGKAELADRVDLDRSSFSKWLKRVAQAGFVFENEDGKPCCVLTALEVRLLRAAVEEND